MSAHHAFESTPCDQPGCNGYGLLDVNGAKLCGRHYVDLELAGTGAGEHYRSQLARAFEMRARGRRDRDIAGSLGVTPARLSALLDDPRQGVSIVTDPAVSRRRLVPGPPVFGGDSTTGALVATPSLVPEHEPEESKAAAPAAATVEEPMTRTTRTCEFCGSTDTVSDRGRYARVCKTHKHLITERYRENGGGALKTGSSSPPAGTAALEPQPAAPDPPPKAGDGAAGDTAELAARVDTQRAALAAARDAEEVAKANVERVMHDLADAIDALEVVTAAARKELERA